MDILSEVCLALCAFAIFVYVLNLLYHKAYCRGYERGYHEGKTKVHRDLFERHVKGLDTTVDM